MLIGQSRAEKIAIPFDINHPQSINKLSYELTEISAITWLKGKIYALNDEMGIIYQLTQDFKIADRHQFAGAGDYEGLTHDDLNFYAMTSDGTVYQVPFSNKEKSRKLETKVPNSCNFEGIFCTQGALFLIAKGNCDDEKYPGKARCLFKLDQKSHELRLFHQFRYKKIKKLLGVEDNTLLIGSTKKPFKKPKPSDIAQDPISRQWYILNDTGKLLLLCDQSGELLTYEHLDPAIYRKPEGLAFDSKGNLFISNEAKGAAATIVSLKRIK